jgi:type II secretory pathway pseudopilin PulG
MLAILGVILTLVIAIVALVAIFKALKNATPEAKLEAAEEAAEAAAEAAEFAADAFNELKDSLSNLDSSYDQLETMTKGTQEWRDAVQEVNKQVLDLIDTYPELAQYVQRDADGVLQLDTNSAEVKNVLDAYENKSIEAENMALATKIGVNAAKDDMAYKNIVKKGKGDGINTSLEGVLVGQAIGSVFLGPAGTVIGAAVGNAVSKNVSEK